MLSVRDNLFVPGMPVAGGETVMSPPPQANWIDDIVSSARAASMPIAFDSIFSSTGVDCSSMVIWVVEVSTVILKPSLVAPTPKKSAASQATSSHRSVASGTHPAGLPDPGLQPQDGLTDNDVVGVVEVASHGSLTFLV